ncbi:MAG: ATP-binding cassette domain-containing protein, partial [Chloroflexota bacterium]|nr:ATP-binding cassette domain-containing protein [Chloroflexota bacterium]
SSNAQAVTEADAAVRGALRSGRRVSIFPLDQHDDDDLGRAVALSFVAWLIEGYGGPALGQYLAAFDPQRDDAAAAVAFHQPLGALEEAWLGTVRHEPRRATAFRTLARELLPLLRPHWLRTLELLALIVVGVGLSVAVPLTIMWIVDHIVAHAHGEYDDLTLWVGLLGLIFLANATVGGRRTYVHTWLTEQVATTLQHRLFAHLQRLSHNFYARARTSDLMAALTTDMREIQEAMTLVGGSGLYQLMLALATAITLLILDFVLGLLVLIVVPVFAFGYMTLRARWQREARGYGRVQAEAEHVAHEQFAANDEIKAFGREEQAVDRYHERHLALVGRHLRMVRLSAMFESTLHLASGAGHVVVFGYGGYQVISHSGATLGTLFAFAHLLPLFYEPIERLADVGHTVEGAANAFDHIDELLAEPVTVVDKPGAIDLPPLEHEITLDHVSFGYEDGRPTLHDLTLSIHAGGNVAIVGPSGSGKSTIVNMLMRFWDPEQGSVRFDGHDLRDVTLASVRGQIGLVSQDTFIFDTSVRENIAVGRLDATDAEIEAAAQAAQIDTWVAALPAGYHTVLGERGVRMSGGQRQRLAIARALLRNPAILVLDEATSSLDPRTETEIQETLAAVGRGRTVISITHRLPAVVTADHIFVVDGGRLVEQGHHAALVKAGGLYQHLYEEQMHYLHGGGVLRVGIEVPRLQRIPLFADLDRDALETVASRFMLERYAAEENVVRQGDPGDKLYAISRGQLDVLIAPNGDSDGQDARRVNTLREGDYFGEMALLTNEPRSATVRTTMPTQLYSLASADFAALMERMPSVRAAVARTVERRRAENAATAAAETAATIVES